jgi:23S rRNA (guanosine2251-2'-O)-methyltransferase
VTAGHPDALALDAALRDRLLDLGERDFAAADRLEARAAADPRLGADLDRLLAQPGTPVVAALAAWDARPDEADALISLTSANLDALAQIVVSRGWPGLTTVGALGADAAWIIAQHGDAANERRRELLDPLRDAVAGGDADPRHYAALVDRIAAVAGERQTYGTIVGAEDEEPVFGVEVEAPDALEARRASLDLPPIADELPYLAAGDLIPYGADRRRAPPLAWPTMLEGHRSIEAALEAASRHVYRILATRPGDRRLRRLRALAHESGVAIVAADAALVDELAAGSTHGGVLAIVGARRYLSLAQLVNTTRPTALLAMLDGIEDPFTYGQAVRALYAAGADGLVVPHRTWESAAAIVARSSAGTVEQLPTARVASIDEAAEACRAAGLRVVCAVSGEDTVPLHEVDLTQPTLVIIGGERRGITRSFIGDCDVRVAIPYAREHAPPLSAAAAAAVIGFEAYRQRAASERPFEIASPPEGVGERSS